MITRHTPFDDLPEVLGAAELTAWLNRPPSSVYHDLESGNLQGFRLGRRWYIHKEALPQAFKYRKSESLANV